MRLFAASLTLALGLTIARASSAFCGFYVSGADGALVNRATEVVLMREGTRTVLSMANTYEGPPQDFALVVPVPVVLQKDQVKTLPSDVLDRVDRMGSPRLVEYWEIDPCDPSFGGMPGGVGQGFGSGYGTGARKSRAPGDRVKIEAQFSVGEYEIVILSATDSTALDKWLRANRYKIPAGAEPLLRPYVAEGSKFFVAKVNIHKAKMVDGRAVLSPLRFHYDSEKFTLPIRLGLINAGDAQDLIVNILSSKTRYEAANYPNVVIPTNLDVSNATRASFGTFYAALFDETLKQKPQAAVTEYSWDAGSCDPCPGPVITERDVATLGGDAIGRTTHEARRSRRLSAESPDVIALKTEVSGTLPMEAVNRSVRAIRPSFRSCYEDAVARGVDQEGDMAVKFVIGEDGHGASAEVVSSDIPEDKLKRCMVDVLNKVVFPKPETGKVKVTQRLAFTKSPPSPPARDMILTRIHMRYSKEALGEDLVLREAPPIMGGRERRNNEGGLEQGAVLADRNGFQARYIIRHPWTGPIACAEPIRSRWGGPPDSPTDTSSAGRAESARDLAFVPRGAALNTFFQGAFPPVGGPTDKPQFTPPPPAPSAPPAASSAAPPASSSATPTPGAHGGCGCETAPQTGTLPAALATILFGLFGLRRRKRD